MGAIFGVACFVWAGWAQENPPTPWGWRLVLVLLGLAGLALAALSIPKSISHWNTPTALKTATGALRGYIIVFWVEVIAAAVSRSSRSAWGARSPPEPASVTTKHPQGSSRRDRCAAMTDAVSGSLSEN